MTATRRGEIEDLLEKIEELAVHLQSQNTEFETLKIKTEIYSEALKKIGEIIGAGKEGLITRIAILEHNFHNVEVYKDHGTRLLLLEKIVRDLEEFRAQINKDHVALVAADKTGKWHVYAALIPGLVAIVIAVFDFILLKR